MKSPGVVRWPHAVVYVLERHRNGLVQTRRWCLSSESSFIHLWREGVCLFVWVAESELAIQRIPTYKWSSLRRCNE